MSHLEMLLTNEIRKALEQMERSHVGYIDGETSNGIYYKIDNRSFVIEIKEVNEQAEGK